MKHLWIAALCAVGMSHVPTLHAQTTWKLATGYRAELFHTENIAQFGREVEAATKSRLKIELAPDSSLFKLNDIRQAVQDGKVQAGETIMRLESMITSAVTGVENKVWGLIKYYYEINAWFPKNIGFVNAKSFGLLPPDARASVLKAASEEEIRGWLASESVAWNSTQELQCNGIKIERLSPDLEFEIKRMGERFSREWVRSVGNDANAVFTPYYLN